MVLKVPFTEARSYLPSSAIAAMEGVMEGVGAKPARAKVSHSDSLCGMSF
jgi:hypothetical protein